MQKGGGIMVITKYRSLVCLLIGITAGFVTGYYWPKTIPEDGALSHAVHHPLNISASFEAFPDGEPILNGVSIVAQRDVDRNPHYRHSMRFLRNGHI
jgi:hypothetical protein